jgi:DNA mismatch repair protein MSH6
MRKKDAKATTKGKAVPAGKGIVRRELKSVLTTGTIVDGSMLTDDLASHCVAIKVRLFCLTLMASFVNSAFVNQ